MKVYLVIHIENDYPCEKTNISMHETYESASKVLREKEEDALEYKIQEWEAKP